MPDNAAATIASSAGTANPVADLSGSLGRAPVKPAPAASPEEVAAAEAAMDSFIEGIAAKAEPAVTAETSGQSDEADEVESPAAAAETVETVAAESGDTAIKQEMALLRAQNAQVLELLAEMSRGRQAAAAVEAPKPAADELDSAVVDEIKSALGLSDEDAPKLAKIIDKIAAKKIAPAMDTIKSNEQRAAQAARDTEDRSIREAAIEVMKMPWNEALFGKPDAPFASLPPSIQQNRTTWLEEANDKLAGAKVNGRKIDPKEVLLRAFYGTVGKDIKAQSDKKAAEKLNETARNRRSVPPTMARNGVSAPQTVRRGKVEVDVEAAANAEKALERYLGID